MSSTTTTTTPAAATTGVNRRQVRLTTPEESLFEHKKNGGDRADLMPFMHDDGEVLSVYCKNAEGKKKALFPDDFLAVARVEVAQRYESQVARGLSSRRDAMALALINCAQVLLDLRNYEGGRHCYSGSAEEAALTKDLPNLFGDLINSVRGSVPPAFTKVIELVEEEIDQVVTQHADPSTDE